MAVPFSQEIRANLKFHNKKKKKRKQEKKLDLIIIQKQ